MEKMESKCKAVLAWVLLIMYPVLAVGYMVVALGIAIKIFGYILKFDFECAWDELRRTNEDFKL